MLMLSDTIVDAQNEGEENSLWHPTLPHTTQKKKGLCNSRVIASYNNSTTALTIRFLSNGQGGRVEIYRNGAKMVNASAAAGASLNYVLRNYGVGNYTVIVSQGNTVVYSKNMYVK